MSTSIPTIPSPEGLDVAFNEIQDAMAAIPWIQASYGHAKRVKVEREGNSYFLPEVDNSKREMIPLEPDDKVVSFSFIEKQGNELVRNFNIGQSSYGLSQNIGVIVFANTERISNTTDYLFEELLKKDTEAALLGVTSLSNMISISSGLSDGNGAWSNYSYNTFKAEYHKENFVTFRYNIVVDAFKTCPAPNVFSNLTCQ